VDDKRQQPLAAIAATDTNRIQPGAPMTNFNNLAGPIRELSVLAASLLAGLFLLPLALYFASPFVLGIYGGSGYAEFSGILRQDIRTGQPGAWIMVVSPYVALQALRLSLIGWSQCGVMRNS
jgi:hypothetical protein